MYPDRKALRSSNRTAVSQSWRSKLPSLRMRFSHFGRTKEIGTPATKGRLPVRLRTRRTSTALRRDVAAWPPQKDKRSRRRGAYRRKRAYPSVTKSSGSARLAGQSRSLFDQLLERLPAAARLDRSRQTRFVVTGGKDSRTDTREGFQRIADRARRSRKCSSRLRSQVR